MKPTKHIDYAKVSQYLKEYYECDRILIDFHTHEGILVIHKHTYHYHPDGKQEVIIGKPTCYYYSDFEDLTERLENENN